MFLIILMNILFASTFRIGKAGLQYTDEYFLTGSRMILAGIIFLGVYYFSTAKKNRHAIGTRDWFLFAQTALFYVILSFVPEFWALKYISPLKANILWSALPFISAFLGYLLLKERLTLSKVIGLTIGSVALIPVLLIPDQITTLHETAGISLPELMMIVAVTSTAYAWFLIKRLLNKGYSLSLINGITMGAGGVATIILRYLILGTSQPAFTNYLYAFEAIIALTVASNILGYMIYGMLLKTYSLTLLSFSGFLCPIFGAFIEKCIFNQSIDYRYLIAFGGIFIGLYIFYRSELPTKDGLETIPTP